jgi:2-polyprenyl-3-methyl-5-hydroxy-6-metoxy-1,4-benzoquinol methylase
MKNAKCPICSDERLRKRPERLRDSETISVLECESCTHVFLDSFEHINEGYFERGEFLLNKPFLKTVEDRLRHYEVENRERATRVGPLVVNRKVLDFGCGAGALMEKLNSLASEIEGLEPTDPFRTLLQDKGFTIYETVDQITKRYDNILMFHVAEHLANPVATLRKLSVHLNPGGSIYLEVPNVNDALISLYDIEASRKFLFFRDHLQYFSRTSLTRAVKQAGLRLVSLNGHNRFGLSNHLYWLRYGKPGGHKIWSFLETPTLVEEYARTLAAADMSDSLVAQIAI